jgi:hypothetical protein
MVRPSEVRESSICSRALRASRSSPLANSETRAWIRVSPTYWSCS